MMSRLDAPVHVNDNLIITNKGEIIEQMKEKTIEITNKASKERIIRELRTETDHQT